MNNILSLIQQLAERLSPQLESDDTPLKRTMEESFHYRHWFTSQEIGRRIEAILQYLQSEKFITDYSKILPSENQYNIAFVSEENIPLEEFFSLISLLLKGHNIFYRPSQQQDKTLQFVLKFFVDNLPLNSALAFTENKLTGFDKIIISSRTPMPEKNKIFLKQKYSLRELSRYQSIAILPENPTLDELKLLATDIFSYFGMGSGNVKKIYIPYGFDFNQLFIALEDWYFLTEHHAYMNNYQYQQSVYLMNKIDHLDNGFVLLKNDEEMRAPTGVLYYEYYEKLENIRHKLNQLEEINTIYIQNPFNEKECYFGQSVNQLFSPDIKIIDFVN
jgi:hypothetical protein